MIEPDGYLNDLVRRIEKLERHIDKLPPGSVRISIELLSPVTARVTYDQDNRVSHAPELFDLQQSGYYIQPNWNGQQIVVVAKDVAQLLEIASRFAARQEKT